MKLEIIDYKILAYVKKHKGCKKQDIFNRFKRDKSIEYRFNNLITPKLSPSGFKIKNSSYIEQKEEGQFIKGEYHGVEYDYYYLTSFGEKALSDYNADNKNKRFYEIKHSFIYPILSAIITAYLTTNFLIK